MSAITYSFMIMFNKKSTNVTGFACYLFFSSISRLLIQSVAILGYLDALSAVIFAVIFLGERMSPLQIIGAICIVGGAMFSECYRLFKK